MMPKGSLVQLTECSGFVSSYKSDLSRPVLGGAMHKTVLKSMVAASSMSSASANYYTLTGYYYGYVLTTTVTFV